MPLPHFFQKEKGNVSWTEMIYWVLIAGTTHHYFTSHSSIHIKFLVWHQSWNANYKMDKEVEMGKS